MQLTKRLLFLLRDDSNNVMNDCYVWLVHTAYLLECVDIIHSYEPGKKNFPSIQTRFFEPTNNFPTLHHYSFHLLTLPSVFNLRRRARLRERSASMDAPMNEMMTMVTFMLSKVTKLTTHSGK